MAPLIKTTIGLLLGYMYTQSPQSILEDKHPPTRIVSDQQTGSDPSISVASLGRK